MKLRDWLEQHQKEMLDIRVDQAEIKKDIKHHIRRTSLLEENMNYLRKEFNPIKTHIAITSAVTKGLLWVTSVVAGLAAIYKIFM